MLALTSMQEDAEAVATAVRLAEAAADAEAASLVAASGDTDAVHGSQAGQTGEQQTAEEDSTVVDKAHEDGMVAARDGDLERLRSLVGADGSQERGSFDPHTATDVHGECNTFATCMMDTAEGMCPSVCAEMSSLFVLPSYDYEYVHVFLVRGPGSTALHWAAGGGALAVVQCVVLWVHVHIFHTASKSILALGRSHRNSFVACITVLVLRSCVQVPGEGVRSRYPSGMCEWAQGSEECNALGGAKWPYGGVHLAAAPQ